MSIRDRLIATQHDEPDLARRLGADSLAYLSNESMFEALDATRMAFCDACFTGETKRPLVPPGR